MTVALLLGLFALVSLQVLSQGQNLLINLRDGLKGQEFLPFEDFLSRLNINDVIGKLQAGLASGLSIAQNAFSSVFIGIFGAVISLYMLIDGGRLWQAFLKLLPATSRDRFAHTFEKSFIGFIQGQMLLMLFLSGTTLIVFPFLGVNYSLLLAIIIGLIDAIPGIGATLGTIVVTFLVFATQGGGVAL
ncbi:MAG: AI-2E family transporter [Leptolyngbyaceae cyanobacterium HOT.MB2.61]|nr:AI-2E family transporter [Leptolyngbyaceae cyanobacterium HOT.MB2.61]